ncbi:hypothetical protein RSOLAG1IB_07626 [Rhizoctonia solani AG-1 IB]|uniref:Transmembrane protein n=1 Tax=Thanatephorus cucumeris (strain AG1-IB / isolate 7/3/14) TaxID=1108050 RepID=A0A0B7FF20_THACB|nr:hypothetical protein RSOLAG1IB_07626 [Rhizoctonia solani AG-1 IB]
MFTSQQRWLLLTLLLTSHLGTVCGGPIKNELGLVARQDTTTAQASSTEAVLPTTTVASQTTVQSSATSVVASSSVAPSVVSTTASAALTTASASSVSTTVAQSSTTAQTSTHTTSQATTTTSNIPSSSFFSSSSSSTTPSSTSSAAATASATASSNIFNPSNRYFGYAIGVTVVVGIFVLLLLALVIRWIVQKFSKKPKPSPITDNPGAWRYSEDTELYSPSAVPNSADNTISAAQLARHKGVGAQMGEAQAFLSTESVTLYPPAKYTDEEADPRRHSRSLSNASSSTTTPYIQRRPMSFLHSPPATHPAFIVDRDQDSNSGHGHSDTAELRAVPEASQAGQVNAADPARFVSGMLVSRAGHSDAYRQPTLGSTSVSRAASTASAYSQPSGIHTPPPMPEMPPLPRASTPMTPRVQAHPRPQSRDLSPDASAALPTAETNVSTDTIPEDGLVHSQDNDQPTVRQMPGRMGWGRQAPTSIHSHSDLFFGHEQR